mmetsp:Transcript_18667/g.62562  ORF Transcript_18667/g.62562 Transcript_18667/m.62562 type:complete len:235 (+) Transcript_18667:106-810(+)
MASPRALRSTRAWPTGACCGTARAWRWWRPSSRAACASCPTRAGAWGAASTWRTCWRSPPPTCAPPPPPRASGAPPRARARCSSSWRRPWATGTLSPRTARTHPGSLRPRRATSRCSQWARARPLAPATRPSPSRVSPWPSPRRTRSPQGCSPPSPTTSTSCTRRASTASATCAYSTGEGHAGVTASRLRPILARPILETGGRMTDPRPGRPAAALMSLTLHPLNELRRGPAGQ